MTHPLTHCPTFTRDGCPIFSRYLQRAQSTVLGSQMAGRRILTNVAHGITGSFVSRNNDVDGYWALGQLLSHTLASTSPSLIIDLGVGCSTPAFSAEPLSPLPARWSEVFWKSVDREGLARSTVRHAELSLECDLASDRPRDEPKPLLRRRRTEYLVRCRTAITDDRGRVYEATNEVWCAPHDPAFEFRSTRGA